MMECEVGIKKWISNFDLIRGFQSVFLNQSERMAFGMFLVSPTVFGEKRQKHDLYEPIRIASLAMIYAESGVAGIAYF